MAIAKRLNCLIIALGTILVFSGSGFAQSDSQPTSFEFYFNGPARGMRLWSRTAQTWTEKYSSGQKGTFQVRKAYDLEGMTGTLVQKVDERDFFVFIADTGSSKMEVWTYKGKGPWLFLAKMKNIAPEHYTF